MLPEGAKYVYPDGGLFTWVELPDQVDTAAMLGEAMAQKVAYVPGREFFVEGQPVRNNCMRVCFGSVTPDKIQIGMERLSKVIRSKL
jgi:2-aminoadipate transaminase